LTETLCEQGRILVGMGSRARAAGYLSIRFVGNIKNLLWEQDPAGVNPRPTIRITETGTIGPYLARLV